MNLLNPKKCCFCLPLRKGLLCIGYLRLILLIVTIAELTSVSVSMFKRMQDSYEDAVTFLKTVATIVPQLLDLIFTLTFITAGHKKSGKLFEVYYMYCATMVLVYCLAVVLVSFNWRRFSILYSMLFLHDLYIDLEPYVSIALGVVIILFQIYLTLLVRSEALHLKERTKAVLARQRSTVSFRLPQLNRVV